MMARKRLGEGNGNPLQYSCLENPMDGGAWWAAVYGVAQSWTRLKQLSSSSSRKRLGRGTGWCNVLDWYTVAFPKQSFCPGWSKPTVSPEPRSGYTRQFRERHSKRYWCPGGTESVFSIRAENSGSKLVSSSSLLAALWEMKWLSGCCWKL